MKKILIIIASYIMISNAHADDIFTGKISSVPKNIQKEMLGLTWHKGCPVGFDQLAYLKLTYWGFDNKTHEGELIVNKTVSAEVMEIFKRLFENHFQIESMKLPETIMHFHVPPTDEEIHKYLATDNTMGFDCRPDEQTPTQLSMHSFGYAIDVNPQYNPAIIPNSNKKKLNYDKKYFDRNVIHIGMIKENDSAFRIFTDKGWMWGGFFKSVDYMHFQKVISKYYMAARLTYIPPDQRIENLPK